MATNFTATLSPMVMLFICILIGYVLNKFRIIPENSATVLSRLEKYVFLPALCFSTFSTYCTVASLKENIAMFPYAVLALVISMAMAFPLSKLFESKDVDKRNIYKYSLTIANHGFMGNAIVPLILGGQEHLYMYLLFTLPLYFITYIWGINILTPKTNRSGNVFKNLINPPILSMAIGIVAGLTNTQKYIPEFLNNTVSSLQACMGPVAMILAGFAIADYKFKELLTNKKVYIATALRLVILPAIIILILKLFGASNYMVTLALFGYATPLGLNTIVFPAIYDGDTKTGASMAMISHVFCIITIPLMYTLLNAILR